MVAMAAQAQVQGGSNVRVVAEGGGCIRRKNFFLEKEAKAFSERRARGPSTHLNEQKF
jgi:hypothetical protein